VAAEYIQGGLTDASYQTTTWNFCDFEIYSPKILKQELLNLKKL